jgi:hypothetical protein
MMQSVEDWRILVSGNSTLEWSDLCANMGYAGTADEIRSFFHGQMFQDAVDLTSMNPDVVLEVLGVTRDYPNECPCEACTGIAVPILADIGNGNVYTFATNLINRWIGNEHECQEVQDWI